MSSANGTRVTVDGHDVISLASNNYLGLNTHPRLVEAAADAARGGSVPAPAPCARSPAR